MLRARSTSSPEQNAYADGAVFLGRLTFFDDGIQRRSWSVRKPFPDAAPFKYVVLMYEGAVIALEPVEDV